MDPSRSSIIIRPIKGVEDLRNCVRGATLKATQLAPGPCCGTVLQADIAGLVVNAGVFRGDVRARGVMAVDKVTLAIILGSNGFVGQWCCQAMAGDIFLFPGDDEQQGRFWGTVSYATIALSSVRLAEAAASFGHAIDPSLWSQAGQYRAAPGARDRTVDTINGCLTVLQSIGRALTARAENLLHEEMLDAFLATLAQAVPVAPESSSLANGAVTIRLVEDYVAAFAGETVEIPDICHDLRLSRRTLDRSFQEHLGTGPKTYLRLSRLSAARAALMDARPGTASVTQVALDHGFSELGRFSVLYRRMFGETPAQTLRSVKTVDRFDRLDAFDWRLARRADGLPAPGTVWW